MASSTCEGACCSLSITPTLGQFLIVKEDAAKMSLSLNFLDPVRPSRIFQHLTTVWRCCVLQSCLRICSTYISKMLAFNYSSAQLDHTDGRNKKINHQNQVSKYCMKYIMRNHWRACSLFDDALNKCWYLDCYL